MFTYSELLEKVNSHLAGLAFSRPPEALYEPIGYSLSMGGKRIRPVLLLMAYNLYRDDVAAVLDVAAGMEIYHNYTLLHDDLMDRADKRRGKETVHKLWGDNVAILSGDAMLVLAYQFIAKCPSAHLDEVLGLFSRTALEICEGQQMDMEFERRNDVAEGEYLEMIRLKTSVLLASSLEIGAVLGGASRSDASCLYDFGVNMGMAFQLKDDLLDVYGNPEVFGKNIGGDILCNKKTFLLIKALEHADGRQSQELRRWLEAEAFDAREKITAVTGLYDQIGVKGLCEAKMEEYGRRAQECLAAVSVNPEKKQALGKLLEKLMYRDV